MHPPALPVRPFIAAIVAAALLTVLAGVARAQGLLTPDAGAPGPSQKSLQEIWDQLAALDEGSAALAAHAAEALAQARVEFAVAIDAARLPWQTTTLATGDCRAPSLAFAPDGRPAVAWLATGGTTLMFARSEGGAWVTQIVDTGDFALSACQLVFDPEGQPAIGYIDEADADLRLARFDGAAWQVETIAADCDVNQWASLAFGPDGQPAVAFHDAAGYDLKFARFDGATWTIELVDAAGIAGYFPSLAFAPDGRPAISYTDASSLQAASLYLAHFDGTSWVRTTVDGDASVNDRTSLAFGPEGRPVIAYFDLAQMLKVARFDGSTWAVQLSSVSLEPPSGAVQYAGRGASLAFGPDGRPVVSCSGALDGHVSVVRSSGAGWSWQRVGHGPMGGVTSLAFDPAGQPALAHATLDGLTLVRRALLLP